MEPNVLVWSRKISWCCSLYFTFRIVTQWRSTVNADRLIQWEAGKQWLRKTRAIAFPVADTQETFLQIPQSDRSPFWVGQHYSTWSPLGNVCPPSVNRYLMLQENLHCATSTPQHEALAFTKKKDPLSPCFSCRMLVPNERSRSKTMRNMDLFPSGGHQKAYFSEKKTLMMKVTIIFRSLAYSYH